MATTHLFCLAWSTKGRVIAFEPIPPNIQIRTENINLNDCANVEDVNKAVSDKSARYDSNLQKRGRLSRFLPARTKIAQSIGVNAVWLDDFLTQMDGPINFTGIDVEGAEAMVLTGAKKTIGSHHLVLIEVYEGADLEPSQVLGLLTELGYELKWLSDWEGTSHVLASREKAPSGGEPTSHRLCAL